MHARITRLFPPGIRLSIACWYTASFVLLLLLTGAVFYQYLEHALEAGVDSALVLREQQLASSLVLHGGPVVFSDGTGARFDPSAATSPAPPADVTAGVLVRVLSPHGRLLFASPAFGDLFVPPSSVGGPLAGVPWQGTITNGHGWEVRLVSRILRASGRPVAVIQVGQSLTSLHELLHTLIAALLLVGLVVLLLSATCSYWLAAHALAPIRTLSRTARAIAAGDLSQRVAVPRARDEVQELALTLNAMLAALEEAFARERRFVADASHELRTPLSVLRTKTSLVKAGRIPPERYGEVLCVMHEEIERMSRLVSDLLHLSRADAGKAPLVCEPVRFDELVGAVAASLSELVTARGLSLSVAADTPVVVQGDEARLIQVVLNLVENAIHYTPRGGRIWMTVAVGATVAKLVIRDTGIGIAREHLPHLFERFYRADAARERIEGGGRGLGLAIVAWIVRAHRGTVAVESEVGCGTSFTVTLPLMSSQVQPGPEGIRHATMPSSASERARTDGHI
jgi:two-component system OmpR family sensor kinase